MHAVFAEASCLSYAAGERCTFHTTLRFVNVSPYIATKTMISRCVLVVALCCAAVAAASASAPPPLPFTAFTTDVARSTMAWNTAAPASYTVTYDSFNAVVDAPNLRCDGNHRTSTGPSWAATNKSVLYDFTTGVVRSAVLAPDGSAGQCTHGTLPAGSVPAGGGPGLVPANIATLTLSGAIPTVGVTGNVYKGTATAGGLTSTVEWSVLTPSNVPYRFVNRTVCAATGAATDVVVKFATYAKVNTSTAGVLATPCAQHALCKGDVCIANPASNASHVGGALQWVCSGGKVNCTYIDAVGKGYTPNTMWVHASWAFQQYYARERPSQGNGACYFGGVADVTLCSSAATKCVANPAATPAVVAAAFKWVCGDSVDCAPIRPGGAHYQPDTPAAHEDWAFNRYYQAFKCKPTSDAWSPPCDFGGAAVVQPA
jgi:hypothetical protein